MFLKMQKRSLAFLLALVLLLSTFMSTAVVTASAAEADVADVSADVEAAEQAANVEVTDEAAADADLADTGVSYQEIADYNPVGYGSGDYVTVETDVRYPWTVDENTDEYEICTTSDVSDTKALSFLKITAQVAGVLDLDYLVDCYGGTSYGLAYDTTEFVQYSDSLSYNVYYNSYFKSSSLLGKQGLTGLNNDWRHLALRVEAGQTYYFAYCNSAYSTNAIYGQNKAWIKNICVTPYDEIASPSVVTIHTVSGQGTVDITSFGYGFEDVSTFTAYPGERFLLQLSADTANGYGAELYSDADCTQPITLTQNYCMHTVPEGADDLYVKYVDRYVALDGYSPLPDDLSLYTEKNHGWVIDATNSTITATGSVLSANQDRLTVAPTYMKLTAARSGILSFDYEIRTRTGDSYGTLAYRVGAEPVFAAGGCDNYDTKSSFNGSRTGTLKIGLQAGQSLYVMCNKTATGNTSVKNNMWIANLAFDTEAADSVINIDCGDRGFVTKMNSAGSDPIEAPLAGLAGLTTGNIYVMPKMGYKLEGLYEEDTYETKVSPTSTVYPNRFNLTYAAGEKTYYAKFEEDTPIHLTIRYDPTAVSDVRLEYTYLTYSSVPYTGSVPVPADGQVTVYPKSRFYIKYSVNDDYMDKGVTYTDENGTVTTITATSGKTVYSSAEKDDGHTWEINVLDNSYQEIEGITADGAKLYTRPLVYSKPYAPTTTTVDNYYPWRVNDEGILESTNKGVAYSFSCLKIVAEKAGMLNFDYRVSSKEATNNNYYSNNFMFIDREEVVNRYSPSNAMTASRAKDDFSGDTGWRSFALDVKENEAIYVYYWKYPKTVTNEDTAWVKNIVVNTVTNTISYSSNNEAYGTVSAVGLDADGKADAGDMVTLTAVPTANGQFMRWEEQQVEGNWLIKTKDPELSFMASLDKTYRAVFAPAVDEADAVAKIDDVYFADLDTAMALAGADDKVILIKSFTQPHDLTIPAGVTLLLPYQAGSETIQTNSKYIYANTEHNYYTNSEGTKVGYSGITQPGEDVTYKLSFAENAKLTVSTGAKLIVGGKFSGHQPIGGATYGAHSEIDLAEGAAINVDGGILSTYGYITGSGNVNLNGGSLYQPYVVTDFHGGTYCAVSYGTNNESPFNTYTMMNVRSTLTMDSSSSIYGYCSLYAMSQQNRTCAKIVGSANDDAILKLDEGTTATFTYDPDMKVDTDKVKGVGRTNITIDGDMTIGYLSMSVGVTIRTNSVYFSIPYNYSITQKSGTLSVPYKCQLLPGAEVYIEKDATLDVSGGLLVYDCMAARVYSAGYAYPDNVTLSNNGFSERAHLIVDGQMNITGVFAGIVENNGTGQIDTDVFCQLRYDAIDGVLENQTYMEYTATSTNRTTYYLSAMLLDNSGDEPQLVRMAYNTTYYAVGNADYNSASAQYIDGVSGEYKTLTYATPEVINGSWGCAAYISFDANGGTGTMDDLDWLTTGESFTLPLNAYTRDGYEFLCWNTKADGSGDRYDNGETTMLSPEIDEYGYASQPESVTLYAQWIAVEHSLTLDGKIGVNFYVKLPEAYDATNTTVDFSWGHKYIAANTYSDTEPYITTNVVGKSDGEWTKYTVYVAAKELNDEITAELKDENGDVISTQTYSGTEYAYQLLAKTDDELNAIAKGNNGAGLRATVVSMLNYCAASQVNFQYHVDDLANARLSDAEKQLDNVGELTAPDFGDVSWGWYYGSSVNLGSDNAYSVYFVKNDRNSTIEPTITYTRPDDSRVDDTTGSCEITEEALAIRATVSNIPAAEVLKTIKLNIDGSDHEINIGSYIKTVLDPAAGSDDGLKNVATALYHYGAAAQAYFV